MNPRVTSSKVFVVDDDAAVRDSVSMLVATAGHAVETFDSAETFLVALHENGPACLVLDMRMAGMSGVDLQSELARRGVRLPIIFVSAHDDIAAAVQAMKGGAVDFLTKPVDCTVLLDRVRSALERSRDEHEALLAAEAVRGRLSRLTARELDILGLVLAGRPNKAIARELGISFRTVEVHRSRILLKTGASTFLELARLVASGAERRAQPLPSVLDR